MDELIDTLLSPGFVLGGGSLTTAFVVVLRANAFYVKAARETAAEASTKRGVERELWKEERDTMVAQHAADRLEWANERAALLTQYASDRALWQSEIATLRSQVAQLWAIAYPDEA